MRKVLQRVYYLGRVAGLRSGVSVYKNSSVIITYYKLNFRRVSDLNILKPFVRIVKLVTKNNQMGPSPS